MPTQNQNNVLDTYINITAEKQVKTIELSGEKGRMAFL
jgi:hypothetical protein